MNYRASTSDADAVAVLSEAYASRMFESPVKARGQTIVLGETVVTVVGVSADAFAGTQVGVRTDIVVPAPVVGRIIGLQPNSVPLRYVFGRLADGGSIAEVHAEWSAIWQSELASSASAMPSSTAAERWLVVSSGATGVSGWRSGYREPLQITMMATAWRGDVVADQGR